MLLRTNTPLESILDTLNASIICGNMEDFGPSGRVLVAALERERLKEFIKAGDIVIMGNKEDCIIEVINSGANLIISTCNVRPGQKAIASNANNNRETI